VYVLNGLSWGILATIAIWVVLYIGFKICQNIDRLMKEIFLKFYLKDVNANVASGVLSGFQGDDDAQPSEDDVLRQILGITNEQTAQRWMIPEDHVKRVKLLGEGGFGDVFLANFHHTKVALKSGKAVDAAAFEESVDEYLLHMDINHPNVVQCCGAVLEPTSDRKIRFSFVLELLHKGSLDAMIYEGPNMERQLRIDCLKDVGIALEHLHMVEPSVVHCDIKSDNVFVDANNKCKIGDLGGSRYTNRTGTHFSAPFSALWASPQRCKQFLGTNEDGEIAVVPADDVYAYGVVIYEVLMRQEPFGQFEELEDLIEAVGEQGLTLAGNGKPISMSLDSHTSQLWDLMAKCTNPEAEIRPTMVQVCEALETIEASGVLLGGARYQAE